MQIFGGIIGTVNLSTKDRLDAKSAKQYAQQKLSSGKYKNCTIGKVYVNGMLVLENVRTP